MIAGGGSPLNITLVGMFKNEAPRLARSLRSVEGIVSYYCFTDTGSTDSSVEILEEFLQTHPGELHHDDWSDFGTGRTRAFAHAHGRGDLLLMLDADEELVIGEELTVAMDGREPERVTLQEGPFDGDAFCIWQADYLWLPRLFRADLDWRWYGRVHEVAFPAGFSTAAMPYLYGVTIKHHQDGASRAGKLQRDLAALLADYRDCPTSERTVFYLGYVYDLLWQFPEARKWWALRASMPGGDDIERDFAELRLKVGPMPVDKFFHARANRDRVA